MPSIRNIAFAGMRPAISPRLLDGKNGTIAHNADLTDGSLRAFQEPRTLHSGGALILDVFVPARPNGKCLPPVRFDHCVSVVEPTLHDCAGFDLMAVFPDVGTAYLLDASNGQQWPLGVEASKVAPQLVVNDAGTQTNAGPDMRVYLFTWVDEFGIESAPSRPSVAITVNDDARVTLSGFGTPPSNAETLRIYRTGAKPEDDAAQDVLRFDTPFQLVDEVSASTVMFLDDRRLEEIEFGTLPTMLQCLPPENLKGVIETDTGYYVGFKGNTLHISERHEVWNWPGYNDIQLPDKITGIAESGDIIYVATTGSPARITLTLGEDNLLGEQTLTTMVDVVRSEQKYPGMSQRSIAPTGFGAVYVSEKGLIAISAQGDAVNLTRERIGERGWPAIAPSRIVWQHGFVYGISPHKPEGLRFEVRGEGDGGMTLGDFTTISMQGVAIHAGRDGNVYFAQANELFAWNRGDRPLRYRWASKRFSMTRRTAFTAAKIVADFGDDIQFTLLKYATDGSRVPSFSRPVYDGRPFRVNPGAKVTDYMYLIEGTAPVHEVHVSTSITELVEGEQL